MRRTVYYGYNAAGEFHVRIYDESPGDESKEHFVALTRAECQKISKHMQFGKKGDERVIDTVNGKEV